MESIQSSFCRAEYKYLLTREQYGAMVRLAERRLVPDRYGSYSISNVYYDTEDFTLIRSSLEKPYFKQKLRLRSYGTPGDRDAVFLELKKKLDGKVLKRRVMLPAGEAVRYLEGFSTVEKEQIHREIDAFLTAFRPKPKLYLAYDREAFVGDGDAPSLRLTFDCSIRRRWTEPDLRAGDGGRLLLPEDLVLMELKGENAFPLWLVRALEEKGIRQISFSKYGLAFRTDILGEKIFPETEGRGYDLNDGKNILSGGTKTCCIL